MVGRGRELPFASSALSSGHPSPSPGESAGDRPRFPLPPDRREPDRLSRRIPHSARTRFRVPFPVPGFHETFRKPSDSVPSRGNRRHAFFVFSRHSAGMRRDVESKEQDHEEIERSFIMEDMKIEEMMVPADRFPRISEQATFSEALLALEKAQEAFLAGNASQRILLVENANGEAIGKISPMDVVRGLEPNYEKLDHPETLARFGVSYSVEAMKAEYRLWQKPFDHLCRKAAGVKVRDFATLPAENHSVVPGDSMDKAFHAFVLFRHDSLFVVENKRIVGLLRFSDVYRKIFEAAKACEITGPAGS
jgi:hypothetical protein